MTQSMTGFGRATGQVLGREVTVEIKSVNNWFKDIIIRVPKGFTAIEEVIKKRVIDRITRGRVEVWIQVDESVSLCQSLTLDMELARTYRSLLLKLKNDLALSGDLTINHFLEIRDIIRHEDVDLDLEAFAEDLSGLLTLALDNLIHMRQMEGQALAEDFQKRLNLMAEWMEQIWSRRQSVIDETKGKLETRIKALTGALEVDQGRLSQDVAYIVDRCDITEEVIRMRSHLEQFEAALRNGGSVGRRLEFLLQEMGREVNTIGSKSGDIVITNLVVDLKTELEKIREQVQNVE
ncbi:MAG: YicC family protein [Deltaproteobacteria bacterium]|nr:YicC family protein [Deltaproteobacteria bacterium]